MPYPGKQMEDKGRGNKCILHVGGMGIVVARGQTTTACILWRQPPNSYAYLHTFLTVWTLLLPLRSGLGILPREPGQELTLASSWQSARSQAYQSHSASAWILPSSWLSLQAYFPQAESPNESEYSPANTVIAALWELEWRPQWNRVQTPGHQDLRQR